jgi:hypothetical protein
MTSRDPTISDTSFAWADRRSHGRTDVKSSGGTGSHSDFCLGPPLLVRGFLSIISLDHLYGLESISFSILRK